MLIETKRKLLEAPTNEMNHLLVFSFCLNDNVIDAPQAEGCLLHRNPNNYRSFPEFQS